MSNQIIPTSASDIAMETQQMSTPSAMMASTVVSSVSTATSSYEQSQLYVYQSTSIPVAKTPSVTVGSGPSHHSTRYLPTPDLSGSCERRSSKRSIKRKRFDDEVVESSLLKQERPTRDRKGNCCFNVGKV